MSCIEEKFMHKEILKVVEMIECASVYEVATRSALELSGKLSRRLGNRILLKREDTQQVFSFKLRGAYNKIRQLSDEDRKRGVITASAGNHAQGVALAAQKLQIPAVIVMPKTTPDIKVSSVRDFGGDVVLHGNTYDDAYLKAQQLASQNKQVFVHPYDDLDVIAGQGTIAKELLDQCESMDMVFIPVGGGGLIAGVGAYLKAKKPGIKIIAVEPDDAACLDVAMKSGKREILEQVGIFADGVAVRQIGEQTFNIAKHCVDEVLTVNTDEICAAIKDIFDDTRTIAEPAGALAIAGIKQYLESHSLSDKNFIAIVSGANINFDRLRHVAERAEFGEQREAILAVTIAEKPGSFRAFCKIIGHHGITEFNYRYANSKQAHIFVGVKLEQGEKDKLALMSLLESKNVPVIDMTDNEMAKIHIRYMVGGHSQSLSNERLYRFQFPERPGALLRFLDHMGEGWNISLFHYRNHGAAYGRILVGIQVPEEQQQEFSEFLEKIQYPYWDESDNPAFELFLS